MVFLIFNKETRTEDRVTRGSYEKLDKRVKKYMSMDDAEWEKVYAEMYFDRKYPGYNNMKLQLLSLLAYSFLGTTVGYELYTKRSNLFARTSQLRSNYVKLALLPILGLLSLKSVDVAYDTWSYRVKYPEMYQP